MSKCTIAYDQRAEITYVKITGQRGIVTLKIGRASASDAYNCLGVRTVYVAYMTNKHTSRKCYLSSYYRTIGGTFLIVPRD